jgi:hypothetical protein
LNYFNFFVALLRNIGYIDTTLKKGGTMKQTAYLLRLDEKLYHQFRMKCLRRKETVRDRLLTLVKEDMGRKQT